MTPHIKRLFIIATITGGAMLLGAIIPPAVKDSGAPAKLQPRKPSLVVVTSRHYRAGQQ